MTDSKTATERLRELLDERGVEWKEYGHENYAWWEGADGVGWHAENRPSVNGLYVKIEAVLTPQQAIAATLGSEQPLYGREQIDALEAKWANAQVATLGSRECENVGDANDFACSECGARLYIETSETYSMILADEKTVLKMPNYCPNCGAKVIDTRGENS